MNSVEVSERLLFLLWQASWQGALFAVIIGILCHVLRLSASIRALLWLLVGLKFIGGFFWFLCAGPGLPLSVTIPIIAPPTNTEERTGFVAWFAPSLIGIWVVGVLLGLFFVIRRARVNSRTVGSAMPCSDPALTNELAVLARAIGIAPPHIPAVRVVTSESDGPQVTLLGTQPVVLLPQPLLPPSPTALNEKELRFIFAHELAHIRRGDLWAGLAFATAHALFFFHPCAAWAKREWEAAREEACDLLALQACADGDQDTAARYGALLLRLGSGFAVGNESAAAMASSPFSALRRRLTHLHVWQSVNGNHFTVHR